MYYIYLLAFFGIMLDLAWFCKRELLVACFYKLMSNCWCQNLVGTGMLLLLTAMELLSVILMIFIPHYQHHCYTWAVHT